MSYEHSFFGAHPADQVAFQASNLQAKSYALLYMRNNGTTTTPTLELQLGLAVQSSLLWHCYRTKLLQGERSDRNAVTDPQLNLHCINYIPTAFWNNEIYDEAWMKNCCRTENLQLSINWMPQSKAIWPDVV